MHFIVDFHTHSHYSRATSPEMNVSGLTRWAQLKGTTLIGTGDFTHPLWFAEMRETLEPAESGLFKLSSAEEREIAREVPERCRAAMRFLLTVEVSTIYKRAGRVRKVHSLILAPSFKVAAKVNDTLRRIGNISSDGRPILGLDTEELLKIVLDASEECMLIPAHAWTPHFAVFGSASGFDSLEEAFGESAKYIHAIETGLSSDPAMNWRLSALDRLALVSNSDAHSPRKLGREANVFNTNLSYAAITGALKRNDPEAFESTIEFYPEEGKYHLDGHRLCKTRLKPEETRARGGLCPACGKPVTVGVMHRVASLADRGPGARVAGGRPFRSIVPLPEIIAEALEVGPQSKRVDERYFALLAALGNEFYILLDAPIEDIARASTSLIAEAVRRMRAGEVHIAPGYDGEYGTVKIFDDGERIALATRAASAQTKLF
ncbi:MAG: endonuclease Q family protein [bacterium]|nr:endonuclease Q family protein [bacterium]MDZ4285191.1 endonuclease Q family protein [Patescibacteria group bacterium]